MTWAKPKEKSLQVIRGAIKKKSVPVSKEVGARHSHVRAAGVSGNFCSLTLHCQHQDLYYMHFCDTIHVPICDFKHFKGLCAWFPHRRICSLLKFEVRTKITNVHVSQKCMQPRSCCWQCDVMWPTDSGKLLFAPAAKAWPCHTLFGTFWSHLLSDKNINVLKMLNIYSSSSTNAFSEFSSNVFHLFQVFRNVAGYTEHISSIKVCVFAFSPAVRSVHLWIWMMKEARRFCECWFTSSCRTILLWSLAHCSSCSNTSAREQRSSRLSNRSQALWRTLLYLIITVCLCFCILHVDGVCVCVCVCVDRSSCWCLNRMWRTINR